MPVIEDPRLHLAVLQIQADPFKHTTLEWAELLNITPNLVNWVRRETPRNSCRRPDYTLARTMILANPTAHSAQEWADKLNVSRTFVYKVLKS